MNKQQFLAALKDKLNGLPQSDIEKSADYYNEMIEDRMEDGLTEEEAVSGLGEIGDIASQILMDTSLPKLVKERIMPSRSLRAWEIALLVLGSPLWLPLLLTAIVLFFSIYVVLWSLIAALYAVDLSFAAGAVGGIGGAVSFFATGFPVQAFLFLGLGLLCAGITILLFFVFNRAALQIAKLGKTIVLWIKSWFLRREETK